ncbi:MAG TPA: DUF294 nucleotidyltransferase-like domain-containing protein, partial [Chthonomonadaceae bacterium]|nr:DUF294 nucleotidyltransferase-like domain-containing protein [Chthonomonadaceae bacterium]
MTNRTEPEVTLEISGDRPKNPHIRPLTEVPDAAGLADYLRKERSALIGQLQVGAQTQDAGASGGGLAFTHRLSDLMDAVIARMFTLACAQAGTNPLTLPIAIVATGGYGRRELCPFSDIDITFIPARDGDPPTDRVIRAMFTLVMDVCIARCGLEVGYAYRLLEDCANLDHQTASGLLDARLLVGSERLFIQFEDAFWLGFNPTDFIFTKLKEREGVLDKWGRLPRVVEPQLKEGPGGLRDLQTAIWLMQARDQLVAARVRGSRGLQCLARDAKLPTKEAERLAQARELVFRVRNALHAMTQAERDELVITRQEEIAALLGYEEGPTPPVERFMADLFPALGLIRRVADQTMRRIGSSRLMLGIGL